MIEEEWSYIPVGGPLPIAHQTVTAFGAAANLVHPATGYSIARSLREAPGMADAVAAILQRQQPVGATALGRMARPVAGRKAATGVMPGQLTCSGATLPGQQVQNRCSGTIMTALLVTEAVLTYPRLA